MTAIEGRADRDGPPLGPKRVVPTAN
jgi:hypothetical protein